MAEQEVVKLQAQLHKLQGQLNDVSKDRDAMNKGALLIAQVLQRTRQPEVAMSSFSQP